MPGEGGGDLFRMLLIPKRRTGNGERGTGVWERVYSGNPPENSKWRSKRRFQTLILSLGLNKLLKTQASDISPYFLQELIAIMRT